MTTAFGDESKVREAVQLGVSDFIVKPLAAEWVVERIGRALSSIKVKMGSQRQRETGVLSPKQPLTLFVADQDSNFRHFFVTTLGTKFTVLEASSGAEAILMALKLHPNAVFLSSQLGVLSRDATARKIREMDEFSSL